MDRPTAEASVSGEVPPQARQPPPELESTQEELRRSEQRYRSLLRASAAVLWQTAADGQVLDMPEWRALTGQTVEEVRGWGWLDAIHVQDRARAAAAWAAAAAVEVWEVEFLLRLADGGYRPFLSRAVPILENGVVREWVGLSVDRTDVRRREAERERAHLRVALLAEATTLLSATLDVSEALDRLTGLVVPVLADMAAVGLLEPNGRLHRVAHAHVDPQACADLRATQGDHPFEPTPESPPGQVIRTGQPMLIREIDEATMSRAAATPERVALYRRLGVRSAIVVPLQARRRTLGDLVLVTTAASGRSYDQDDLALAADLGRRAALALDNAQLYTREHEAAEALQRSLLPQLTDVEFLDVCARYLASGGPAEVGGDWYDLFTLPGGSTALAVGDVMGHDLAAAVAMGQLRGVLRVCAWEGDSPAVVLDRLDRLVQGFDMAQIASVCYARLEGPAGVDRLLRYANAGHPPPLLRTPDGRVSFLDGGLSALVGAPATARRSEATVVVPAGSMLTFYTDGLVERRGSSLEHGLERLRASVETAPSEAPHACDAVIDSLVDGPLDDDAALLMVAVH